MDNFAERFVEAIKANNPTARVVSGGKEICCKCVFCLDHPKSTHMYIKIPKDGQAPLYNCFLCNASGIVNSRVLRMLNVYDIDVVSSTVDYTKKVAKELNYKDLDDENKIFNLSNNFITKCPLSEIKLRYINKRIGTNLTYSDLIKNKIILNLGDLLVSNGISTYTRDPAIIQQLNDSFIGFISADNAFVNMRNLTPGKVYKTIDKRYINYNIFGKLSNTQRYYIIPTNIDLSRPDPIKLHIAEGPFDILSIFYNMNKCNLDNSIYAAICGKSYLNIIKYFIEMKGLLNIELHIYPDKDIENYSMINIANYLEPFNIAVYIHRNIFQNEKDFGVPPDRIRESVQQLSINRIY